MVDMSLCKESDKFLWTDSQRKNLNIAKRAGGHLRKCIDTLNAILIEFHISY